MRSLGELMDLQGRVAIVTGGAGHIGAVTCQALAELHAKVVVLDRAENATATVAGEVQETYGVEAVPLVVDLEDERAVRSVRQRVMDSFGRIDILVHCAAYGGDAELSGWAVPFEDQGVQAWEAAIRVNLTAAFILVQETREALESSGHGSVILMASIYGMVGPDHRLYEGLEMASPAGYSASKGGLLQLTRHLATTLAPRVRVNAVSPGGVWRRHPEAFHQRYVSRTPLGRMATEEDLKGAVAYLATDLSAYVTGANLMVDGGWTAW